MFALAPPPHFLWGALFDASFALEVIALVLVIRAYRFKRAQPFKFLLWAFLCLVIPQIGLFVFTAVQWYVFARASGLSWLSWIYLADPISFILFFAFTILCLRSLLREGSSSLHLASNQPMKPTAPSRENLSEFATDPARGLSLSR